MTAPTIADRTRRSELAKAARREEILAAARRVFAKRGFRGTTIADVAEDAGIALGTIYLYFKSKDDVFAALQEQFSQLIADALASVPAAATLEETVRTRIDNVFSACGKNRDLIRLVVLNTDHGSETTKRLRKSDAERAAPMVEAIEAGMHAGAVRSADARIMTDLVLGLVSIAVYKAFVASDGSQSEKYREACGEMVLAYMTPPRVES